MFNRNGSNNGNGVHEDTAIAARNGNGHKPDGNGHKPDGNGHEPDGNGHKPDGNGHKPDAIVTEHDLLWDGLSPAVTQALGQPLDPALASQRKGRGGRVFDYLEGHVVIDQANRIFGYGGWGYELAGDVTLRQIETVDPQTGEIKTVSVYSAPVRVTVAGAPAPHRHRLPRRDRRDRGRPRHGNKGVGDGRHEAGVPQLRRASSETASTATSSR